MRIGAQNLENYPDDKGRCLLVHSDDGLVYVYITEGIAGIAVDPHQVLAALAEATGWQITVASTEVYGA